MNERSGALQGIRVLDLTGARGNYCGKLFADLGADVVLVEPLQGSEVRHLPPYVDDVPGIERSLPFAYQNANKRSVALDLATSAGAAALKRLAAGSDVIIESFMPGTLAQYGLSYKELSASHPKLVMTSITPFGQTGPLADCDAPDLVCLALGGLLYLGGYADGAPMQAPQDQAYAAGGLFAAVASMMAILHSEQTGEGQHVDVSIQECVTLALENTVQFFDLEHRIRRRTGGVQRQAGMGVFASADGYVFVMAGGIGGNRFWPNLVEWLHDEDCPDARRLDNDRWYERSYIESDEAKAIFGEVFGGFAAGHDKEYLGEKAQQWRVPLAPVNAPSEVLKSPQLQHRQYFQDLMVLPGRHHPAPGAPYVLSATPWHSNGRPPRLGEHTQDVLLSQGFARAEIDALRNGGVVR